MYRIHIGIHQDNKTVKMYIPLIHHHGTGRLF